MLDSGRLVPKVPSVSQPLSISKTAHKTEHTPEFDAKSRQSTPEDRIGSGFLHRSTHGLFKSQSDIVGSSAATNAHHNAPQHAEQVALYKSYARETGRNDAAFEAHVRGWLFHPQLNRKGKLMIAAVEKLVGNPGKYSSIADAAAEYVAENSKDASPGDKNTLPLVDLSDSPTNSHGGDTFASKLENSNSNSNMNIHTHSPSVSRSSSWLNFARPPMFRSRSSKSSLKTLESRSMPGSPPGTPGQQGPNAQSSRIKSPASSVPGSAANSVANSTANSADNSATNSAVNSATNSAANTAPNSPVLGPNPGPSMEVTDYGDSAHPPHHTASMNLGSEMGPIHSKRPVMRRTATFTFDPHSNPKGKTYSPSHWARKEQKHTIRERMAAISHKSLAMRDVQIIVESDVDDKGHRKKRTFWVYTDESGRFGQCCAVPFKPVIVTAIFGSARHTIPLVFVPKEGISVISDIDDTVRHTGVTKSKRELLHNVLAKPFDEVRLDGVSEWYNRMAEAGAHFHYVSNSPWQLYDVVHGFLRHHKFPEGSIHLKKYAGVFDGLTEPAKGRKRATLERVLSDFPHHKFILIGDSGEADLEAYADVAQKFASQVIGIYIRDITLPAEEPLSVYDKKHTSANNHSTHRRYHSVDLISMDKIGDTKSRASVSSSKPPKLPPRVRRDLAPSKEEHEIGESMDSPSSGSQDAVPVGGGSSPASDSGLSVQQSTTEHPDAVYTSITDSLSQLSIGESPTSVSNSPAGSYPPSVTSQRLTSMPVSRSATSSPAPSGSGQAISTPPSSVLDSPTVPSLVGETRPEELKAGNGEKPKLPPRPKLLRRTSSKIMEGVYSMASASSHAASRLLDPQIPTRSGSKGSPASQHTRDPHAPGKSKSLKPRPGFLHNLYAHDDTGHRSKSPSPEPGAVHHFPDTTRKAPNHLSNLSANHASAIHDTPLGFVPSSQEFSDYDRVVVDKRGDTWKARVLKQKRILPKHVRLRMWRQPDDVEPETIRLIKGDEDSLI